MKSYETLVEQKARKLYDQGYHQISQQYCIVARTVPGWEQELADLRPDDFNWIRRLGIEAAADHYRRCLSQDKKEVSHEVLMELNKLVREENQMTARVKEFRKPDPIPPVLDTNACLTKGLVLYELKPGDRRIFAMLTYVDHDYKQVYGFTYLREGCISASPGNLKFAGKSARECIEKALAEGRRVFWVESLADIKDIPEREE